MKWRLIPVLFALLLMAAADETREHSWPQWAQNSRHTGYTAVSGQRTTRKLAQITYDPFVAQEKRSYPFNDLVVHYQVPLIADDAVYMEFKTGDYIPCKPRLAWEHGAACGPNTWNKEIWNEKRLEWRQNKLVEAWSFQSDWKPEPNDGVGSLFAWEPVFHPVLTRRFLYVPGFGGTIWKVDKDDGKAISQINPFGNSIDPNTYVAGPLTADEHGNVYYNAIKLDPQYPWFNDSAGAWLVKVSPDGTSAVVSFATLVPDAPPSTGNCPYLFYDEKTLPWPPSRNAKPPVTTCGSQRPGVNIAPAVARDGTIYTISRAHFDPQVSYLVAVNPDLTRKWDSSMQRRLHDGCGYAVPIATQKDQPNACREGSKLGVDPTTNEFGSAWIADQASSTPTVLPDGSLLIGVLSNYNGSRGHLMKFSSSGDFQKSYGFGWDETPAIYPHDGTYSIVIKDNHYGGPYGGLYCGFNNPICAPLPEGPYFITQLNADLEPEWKFKNTTVDSNHPNGYEWCVNAPVVDRDGVVYVTSEDGHAYVLQQGGRLISKLFLSSALGAAYTPLSLGPDGRIYTQNNGVLFVLGN